MDDNEENPPDDKDESELNQDQLDQMLQNLEGEGAPTSASPAAQPAAPSAPEHESPALSLLDSSRLPDPMPVCGACPKSMWFSSTKLVQCYCRMMHVVTWTSEDPQPIMVCDGILMEDE